MKQNAWCPGVRKGACLRSPRTRNAAILSWGSVTRNVEAGGGVWVYQLSQSMTSLENICVRVTYLCTCCNCVCISRRRKISMSSLVIVKSRMFRNFVLQFCYVYLQYLVLYDAYFDFSRSCGNKNCDLITECYVNITSYLDIRMHHRTSDVSR